MRCLILPLLYRSTLRNSLSKLLLLEQSDLHPEILYAFSFLWSFFRPPEKGVEWLQHISIDHLLPNQSMKTFHDSVSLTTLDLLHLS